MGLMPEIERAWISIDHKLFLWDYNDGLVCIIFHCQVVLILLSQSRTCLFLRPTRRDHTCRYCPTKARNVRGRYSTSTRYLHSHLCPAYWSGVVASARPRESNSKGTPTLRYRSFRFDRCWDGLSNRHWGREDLHARCSRRTPLRVPLPGEGFMVREKSSSNRPFAGRSAKPFATLCDSRLWRYVSRSTWF